VSLERERAAILRAALPHVAFEGWTDRAVRLGARDAGLPAEAARRVFPGGIAEIVRYWSDASDRQMLDRLEKEGAGRLPMRDRVARAVRARIEVNALHREAVRRTLAYLALPWNAALGTGSMYRTVNVIWYAAGDTATDIGWYSKRATLAAVYVATLLHWLDDDTEDFAATWAFLDRRIADVMRFGRLRRRVGVGFAGGRPRRA
jgi:ubiquinone biosynthesis protein COQ9